MFHQPTVSVIIATYNRAHYVAETIDSVLSQQFRDFELIVVDDGSTDNTRELLRRYGDRLRFYCQENRGPSAARNLGVRHARGEWIAIQNSDDLCRPNDLEVLFAYVAAQPDCRMVFANGAYLGRPNHGVTRSFRSENPDVSAATESTSKTCLRKASFDCKHP